MLLLHAPQQAAQKFMAVLLAASLQITTSELGDEGLDASPTTLKLLTLKRGAALQMAMCSLLGCSIGAESFLMGGPDALPATSEEL